MASALNNDPNENVTEETLWNEVAQKTRNVILRNVIQCADGKPKRLSLLRVCTEKKVINPHDLFTAKRVRAGDIVEIRSQTVNAYIQSQLKVAAKCSHDE